MNYCDSNHWHEAANIFPLLSNSDLQELADDIEENGLLNPVILMEGKVLDGRNRLLACKKNGVLPTFVEWIPNGVAPATWVISQNLKRRHLGPGQRAAVAVEAKPLLEAEAKRNRARGYANLKQGNLKPGPIRNDTSGNLGQIQKAVAKKFDVSEGYVYAAQKIKDKDEKIFLQLKAGYLSIPDAEKALGFKQSTRAMISSDDNEWYTPENYVKAARSVMGAIDLDPASCVMADKFIKAEKFFTEENNGLTKKWAGRVFLNPPYGDIGPKFVAKLIAEYQAGRVSEAIAVLNSHCTDSKWFQPLFSFVLCFTDHRSRFWNSDGIGGAPTHGSVFVYLGQNPKKFAQKFAQFGSIVAAY